MEGQKSVLQEAEELVNGARQDSYGHPLDNFSLTASLVSVTLAHKLKEPLTAEEMVLVMEQVKIARELHAPKRDNWTDGAGYWALLEMISDERERRANESRNNRCVR